MGTVPGVPRPLHDLSSGAPLEVATGGLRAEQAAKLRQAAEPAPKSAGTQVEGTPRSRGRPPCPRRAKDAFVLLPHPEDR